MIIKKKDSPRFICDRPPECARYVIECPAFEELRTVMFGELNGGATAASLGKKGTLIKTSITLFFVDSTMETRLLGQLWLVDSIVTGIGQSDTAITAGEGGTGSKTATTKAMKTTTPKNQAN